MRTTAAHCRLQQGVGSEVERQRERGEWGEREGEGEEEREDVR